MLAIVLMILVLSFLVLIHELGHFLAARKMGVHVEEFGIGYPPRLVKLFKWKETIFSLNWLPFGGFVRLTGDDAETFERVGDGKAENEESTKNSHMFYHKTQLQRLFIVLAGAAVNILFGILIFAATYTQLGIPTHLPYPKIGEVVAGSPADAAGLQVGDAVYSIGEKEVQSSTELITTILAMRGETVSVKFDRGSEKREVQTYLRTAEETPEGSGSLGVRLIDTEFKHYPAWEMPIRGMIQGTKDSLMFAQLIPQALGGVVVDLVTKAEISDDVSGPIGIVRIADQEQIASQGWMTIFNFAAVISLNLGIINLMPIPALDGGRAVFIVLESVLGKRRRAKIEGYANSVGMLFLLGLIIVISLRDVWKIFVN